MLTHITIPDIHGKVLTQGYYSSYAHCLGEAAAYGISLAGARLAHLDLRAAELDEAHLQGADFTGTNLAGANLSECDLRDVNFNHANLADTCMAYSDLRQSRLLYCRIGATDITGARLDNCLLAGPESFALPFVYCAGMANCLYYDEEDNPHPVNHPPVVVNGLGERIVIMDNSIQYGAGPVRTFPPQAEEQHQHICMS
jgi:hypothetical protein